LLLQRVELPQKAPDQEKAEKRGRKRNHKRGQRGCVFGRQIGNLRESSARKS